MADEKKYTERDLILAKRDGVARMRCAIKHELHFDDAGDQPCTGCVCRAKELLPLPKVKRPRVVRYEGGKEYRVIDGMLEERDDGAWSRCRSCSTFPSVIAFIADLYLAPDELVEDDGQ